jgi:signal peptidase I
MRSKSLFRTLVEPIAIAVGLALLVRAAVHLYAIPTESMRPTLEVGDQIVVTRYLGGAPQRGEIVVFERGDEVLVKRVIGVPGDLIDSRLGRVRIGGYTLPEPYVLREAATGAIESQLVPGDSYFVLGDNRDDSVDSRSIGFVPRERIVGRVRLVLWSSPLQSSESANAATRDSRRRAQTLAPRVFKWIE